MLFKQFKKVMQDTFHFRLHQGGHRLYMTDVDKELLWQTYLNGFPEAERQEHNCNACKSFIRHYGGLVMIIEGKVCTLWDFGCDAPFTRSVEDMAALVRAADITDMFFTNEAAMGTDCNRERQEDGTITTWDHMHFKLPASMVSRRSESVDTLRGKARDNRNVFKRGLEEITLDALDSVLDLIAQNSLYRGAEFKAVVEQFRGIKTHYNALLSDEAREIYAWDKAPQFAGTVAQLRNTSIGTLLLNISEGMDLDDAVGKFEAIMAPTNYKRPNAIISKKMIEDAEKTITELGYANSLGRRFATVDDLSARNLLFVNRDIKQQLGLLGDLKDAITVNPRSLGKVEEIAVADFVKNVLPRSTKVELLFENRHINNLVSLIDAKDVHAPGLFKWPNHFSWSYKNAVTDSIKEKVKAAGGRIEGELRVSLEWYNFDDLDLHVMEPSGRTIWFREKLSPTGGQLDVDMNAGGGRTREPVENVIWPDKRTMKEGRYKIMVNQYQQRESTNTGFSLEVECRGEVLNFESSGVVRGTITVAEIDYTKAGGMKLVSSVYQGQGKVTSRKEWGVETNRFHTVSMIMNSPNFWDAAIGNAHLFFILDAAHNDEQPRGFFNEFLKDELVAHKRVFEALAGKMKVEPADKQVSGLGFSSTQHNDLIVKIDGAFTRTLKIKF